MPEINLPQTEADKLISMEKHRVNDQKWDYPFSGGSISIPLISINKRESFLLDITRSRIDLQKGSYQNRTRQIVVLIRLDFGSKPHRNPDGKYVPDSHLHIYREGYGDKWAKPISETDFADTTDLRQILDDFMGYCNITKPPVIIRGLFI